MLQNLSSMQKALGGILALAAIVGWVFAIIQMGETGGLQTALETARQDLSSAKAESEQAKSGLEAAQEERSQLMQQAETAASLEELTAMVEAGNAELQALQAEIEAARAEAETLGEKVQQQQALLEGSILRFKTNARARVRSGPGTDTAEVAVVPAGNTIQVFEIVEDGTWYRVGGMGYIFHELLEPVESKVAE